MRIGKVLAAGVALLVLGVTAGAAEMTFEVSCASHPAHDTREQRATAPIAQSARVFIACLA